MSIEAAQMIVDAIDSAATFVFFGLLIAGLGASMS